MGFDAIALKSGWDEYGIAYNRSTAYVHIKEVQLQASTGSALAFGSQMSGGISHVLAERLHINDSFTGIAFRTTIGRGGFIKNITASNVVMENVHTAFDACGQWNTHPDDKYDPTALPVVDKITISKVIGVNITIPGSFTGIKDSPFEFSLSNISLSLNAASSATWVCSNVFGSSKYVYPEPCPELESSVSSSSAVSISTQISDGLATDS